MHMMQPLVHPEQEQQLQPLHHTRHHHHVSGVRYSLDRNELAPIIWMQQIALQDTAMRSFQERNYLNEAVLRKYELQAGVFALAVSESAEKVKDQRQKEAAGSGTYAITYNNPETRRSETLSESSKVPMKDGATKAVEESAAAQSIDPLFKFICSPLILHEVMP